MIRFVIVLLVALFYTSQSSALLSGSRVVRTARKSLNFHNKQTIGTLPTKTLVDISGGSVSLSASPGGKGGVSQSVITAKYENALGWYSYQLEQRPLTTKVITSGLLGGLSDIISQILGQGGFNKWVILDMRRLYVFTAVCAFYFAPVIDLWYKFLTKIPFPKETPELGKVLGMLTVDQTIGSFLVTGGFFYAFELINRLIPPYTMHLHSVVEVGTAAAQRSLLPAIFASWRFWPVINFISFKFVPLPYRVLVSNVASIFWNIYMSKMANA